MTRHDNQPSTPPMLLSALFRTWQEQAGVFPARPDAPVVTHTPKSRWWSRGKPTPER